MLVYQRVITLKPPMFSGTKNRRQVDDSQIYAFDQAEQDAIFEKRPWKEAPQLGQTVDPQEKTRAVEAVKHGNVISQT